MAYLEKSIAAVNPKGGEWKTTGTQVISTSSVFRKYKKRILEVDSQGSISDWLYERKSHGLDPIDIELVRYDDKMKIKDAIKKYSKGVDFLFLDLPGESKAAEKTRGALAYADFSWCPVRLSDKTIRAFENNLLQTIQAMATVKEDNAHFYLLPTFAHANANQENHRQIFEAYADDINIMESIHRDRQIFTYFSQGGLTLEEYVETIKGNKAESQVAEKAVNEVNAIASEILKIVLSI